MYCRTSQSWPFLHLILKTINRNAMNMDKNTLIMEMALTIMRRLQIATQDRVLKSSFMGMAV